MARPRPVPSSERVVKNGSKIRARSSGGTPGPVSSTSRNTWSPAWPARSVSVPPSDMARAALEARAMTTCFSESASIRARGRLAGDP